MLVTVRLPCFDGLVESRGGKITMIVPVVRVDARAWSEAHGNVMTLGGRGRCRSLALNWFWFGWSSCEARLVLLLSL